MKHFNFAAIKERGSCIDFVEQVLGEKVVENRCVAVWRGGERYSVRVERDRWFDHVTEEGGGLVELCARSKFGGLGATEIQQAQEWLGEWLHLDEVKLQKKTASAGKNRHDELIAEGYVEKARYEYRDLDGKPAYFVCRRDHADPVQLAPRPRFRLVHHRRGRKRRRDAEKAGYSGDHEQRRRQKMAPGVSGVFAREARNHPAR